MSHLYGKIQRKYLDKLIFVLVTMAVQMYELLEMVEGVELTMENICTLATSLHVSSKIIVDLNFAKLSLVECKNSLITFSHQEYNLDYLERKNNDNINDKDIKPIKIENMGLGMPNTNLVGFNAPPGTL